MTPTILATALKYQKEYAFPELPARVEGDTPAKAASRLGRFFCKVMDWHKPGPAVLGFMCISPEATCQRCGDTLLLDSQGNWFSIECDGDLPI